METTRSSYSPVAGSDLPLDALARQIMDHLNCGGMAGDFMDMGSAEYEALYALGHHLYTTGMYEDAVHVFGYLTLHNHHERRFLMAYAAALQMAKDWAAAVTVYTVVSLLDMRDPLPGFHTCECLVSLGMKREAREGLAMVLHQCGDQHADTRARAEALLALLSSVPSPNPTSEETLNA